MNTLTEALKLADALESDDGHTARQSEAAAAELRRLHASIERYKAGYQGSCYACEPVAERNLSQQCLLRMALEALESSRLFVPAREKIKHPEVMEWYDERIAALRAALAPFTLCVNGSTFGGKAEPQGWQPADTAPKDGTRILVFCLHGGIEISEWFELWWDKYEEAGDGMFRKERVLSADGWNSNAFSHWMPLPKPPEQHGITGEKQ